MGRIGPRHRLAAQKIAAVRVRQGQRLAARPVAGPEPALEVDAPHVVGRRAGRKRRAARAARGGANAASPSDPRGRTKPRSCSPRATPPGSLRSSHAGPSPDPSADASDEPPDTPPQARPTARADAAAARASGPTDPKRPPDNSAHATCNRPAGSPRSAGRARKTCPRPPRSPSQNKAVLPQHRSPSKPSARSSPPSIRPVTYVAGLFRYLCSRFGPPRPSPPRGERGSRSPTSPRLLPSRLREGLGEGNDHGGRVAVPVGTPHPGEESG